MKYATVTLLATFILYGCAALPTPLPEGKSTQAKLFAKKCGACHSVPHPKRHTYEQWERMVSIMDMHSEKNEMELLSDKEKEEIMNYLKKHSR